jgi:hypothetical protein
MIMITVEDLSRSVEAAPQHNSQKLPGNYSSLRIDDIACAITAAPQRFASLINAMAASGVGEDDAKHKGRIIVEAPARETLSSRVFMYPLAMRRQRMWAKPKLAPATSCAPASSMVTIVGGI